jgi:hypothetical protein
MFEGLMSGWKLAFIWRLAEADERTSVDDLAAVQVGEAVQHTLGNLSENLLSRPTPKLLDFLVDTVEASTFAEFHSDGNSACRLVHEGAVVATYVV